MRRVARSEEGVMGVQASQVRNGKEAMVDEVGEEQKALAHRAGGGKRNG